MAGDTMVGTSIEFYARGLPVPEGSTKSFYIPPKKGSAGKGHVVTTHANPKMDKWRQDIKAAAVHRNDEVFEGDRFYRPKNKKHRGDGVRVVCTFYMHKPKNATDDSYPSTIPDIDKLIRAVLDALTDVLWDDDSQVLEIMIRKKYQKDGEGPGVQVKVEVI